jgi:hypothetical protein
MAASRTVRRSSRWQVLVRRNQWLVIGLLAVTLLLWGRLRMRGEIPRTAVADPPVAAAVNGAVDGATDGVEDGAANMPGSRAAEAGTTSDQVDRAFGL